MKNLLKILLTATLIASMQADAMEHAHGTEESLRQVLTIVCSDGVKVNIPLSVLKYSNQLYNMAIDFEIVNQQTNQINPDKAKEEIPLQQIDSYTMNILLQYMHWLDMNNATSGHCNYRIITEMFKNHDATTFTRAELIGLLKGASFLDILLVRAALVRFAAQNLNQYFPYGLGACDVDDNLILCDDLQAAIAIQRYAITDVPQTVSWECLGNKGVYFKTKTYGSLTVQDLSDLGYISQDFVTLPIQSYLANIFAGDINTTDLQNSLNVLSSYPCFAKDSAQAHYSLVEYIRTLQKDQMAAFFNKLQGKSTLKTALQFICAQQYQIELDTDFKVVDIVNSIGNGVLVLIAYSTYVHCFSD